MHNLVGRFLPCDARNCRSSSGISSGNSGISQTSLRYPRNLTRFRRYFDKDSSLSLSKYLWKCIKLLKDLKRVHFKTEKYSWHVLYREFILPVYGIELKILFEDQASMHIYI